MFMKKRGYKMSVFRCFKYGFTEIFFSSITPSSTGGQPMMAISMRNDGYPLAETTTALLAITGLYKAGLILLGIICSICFSGNIFGVDNKWVLILFIIGFIINICVIVLVGLLLFSNKCIWSIFKFVLNVGVKFKIVKNREKTEAFLKNKKAEYVVCANYMKDDPIVPLKVFGATILQRFAFVSVAAFVYKAMGMNDVSFVYIMAIQIIIAITVELIPLPGAVGISETVFITLYLTIYKTQDLLNAGLLITRGLNFYLLFLISALFVNICYISNLVRGLINKEDNDK